MRKWGKLTIKQKKIEDHNSKSGNDRKTWKFYDELSQCLAKDPSVTPVCTLESSTLTVTACNNQQQSSSDDSSSEYVPEGQPQSSENGKRKASSKAKRCRKQPRSRSSAGEMLEFLKSDCEKRDMAEQEKLKILKEMKEEKKQFYDRYFQFLENRKDN